MKNRKPRLIELHEIVASLQLKRDRGESLTEMQLRILEAWAALDEPSRVQAYRLRPWLRGNEIVFRDMYLGSVFKTCAHIQAKQMQ